LPIEPLKPLGSPFVLDPPLDGVYQTVNTGAEVNEMVLTWTEGLEKLPQIEFRYPFDAQMEDVNYGQVWEGLLRKTVKEGRPLSPPPPSTSASTKTRRSSRKSTFRMSPLEKR
jgi:hypothetical protein